MLHFRHRCKHAFSKSAQLASDALLADAHNIPKVVIDL